MTSVIVSPFKQAQRALSCAQATYEVLERPEPAATLFSAAESACLGPWLDAGLRVDADWTYVHQAKISGECAGFHAWRSGKLLTPEGDLVLRLTFWLALTTHANGSVDAVLEMAATEFIGSVEARTMEMQVSRVWGKVDGGNNWPALEAALCTELTKRVEGRRANIPFAQMLGHTVTESLDWLVP